MTDGKSGADRKKKLLGSGLKIAVLIVVFVFSAILMHDKFAGCFRLNREIGATPWHRPETVIEADHSDRWSDGEIEKALLSAEALYESEYFSYNGVYLLKLIYDDDFSQSRQNGDDDRCVYIRSELKIGYSHGMGQGSGLGGVGAKGSTVTDVYWTAERSADGAWHCIGWDRTEGSIQ